MEYVNIGLRALLCAVFLIAAVGKVRSREVRAELVDAVSELLPPLGRLSGLIAWVVAALEVAVVALLSTSATSSAGFALAAAVLAAFTVTLTTGLVRGQRVQCRCFGMDGSTSGVGHIARNSVLITLSCIGLLTLSGAGDDGGGGLVLAAGTGAVAGWIMTRWDDLAFLIVANPAGGVRG